MKFSTAIIFLITFFTAFPQLESKLAKAGKNTKTTKNSKTTNAPTTSPTEIEDETEPPFSPPSLSPSESPTASPSAFPTASPSKSPSLSPSASPTQAPSFPCNLTPEERATQLRQLYAAFSDDALFDDPFTPQAQALDWITNLDSLRVCPDDNTCQPLQRYVLAAFYFATNGGAWDQCNAPTDFNDPISIEEANNNCDRVVTPFAVPNERVGDESSDAWLTPSNECEWGGIACWGSDTPSINLCIDQLDFENDGIAGRLVDEIGALDTIRFFILEQGGIFGTIPSPFGLLILDLDFNSVEGSLPDELYGLSSLQQLDLNDNLITGTISTLIGELNLLTFLQIDFNDITGTIPTEMGELDQLSECYFNDSSSSFNRFVSDSKAILLSVGIVFLSNTDLTGTMPPEVCANRNNTVPPGNLGILVTGEISFTRPKFL